MGQLCRDKQIIRSIENVSHRGNLLLSWIVAGLNFIIHIMTQSMDSVVAQHGQSLDYWLMRAPQSPSAGSQSSRTNRYPGYTA